MTDTGIKQFFYLFVKNLMNSKITETDYKKTKDDDFSLSEYLQKTLTISDNYNDLNVDYKLLDVYNGKKQNQIEQNILPDSLDFETEISYNEYTNSDDGVKREVSLTPELRKSYEGQDEEYTGEGNELKRKREDNDSSIELKRLNLEKNQLSDDMEDGEIEHEKDEDKEEEKEKENINPLDDYSSIVRDSLKEFYCNNTETIKNSLFDFICERYGYTHKSEECENKDIGMKDDKDTSEERIKFLGGFNDSISKNTQSIILNAFNELKNNKKSLF